MFFCFVFEMIEINKGFDDEALEQELNALEDYISDEEQAAPAWLSDLPAPSTAAIPADPHKQSVPLDQ